MISVDSIVRGLKAGGYPIREVAVTPDGEWVEASFRLAGGNVTLVLPPERASAPEFAFLYDMALGPKAQARDEAADDG